MTGALITFLTCWHETNSKYDQYTQPPSYICLQKNRTCQDSNLESSDPQSDALSIAPQVPLRNTRCFLVTDPRVISIFNTRFEIALICMWKQKTCIHASQKQKPAFCATIGSNACMISQYSRQFSRKTLCQYADALKQSYHQIYANFNRIELIARN